VRRALTEAATRLADRPDPVPDEVWDEAARHYTEPQLAALVVAIATINAFNRVNAVTRQITGDYVARIVEAAAGAPRLSTNSRCDERAVVPSSRRVEAAPAGDSLAQTRCRPTKRRATPIAAEPRVLRRRCDCRPSRAQTAKALAEGMPTHIGLADGIRRRFAL
jgi:hypothetical protein